MKMRQAVLIAEAKFGAWVEGDQLYFPTPDARSRWEKHIAAMDAEAESHFRLNGRKWFGIPRGWDIAS